MEINSDRYNEVYEKLINIRTFAEDIYGKDRVDLQIPTLEEFDPQCTNIEHLLYIYFPEVHLTNELGQSALLKKLWVRVLISTTGRLVGMFEMCRTHVTVNQLLAGFVHSHISIDSFNRFSSPCLGSGPIRVTQGTLQNGYNEGIWRLFFVELERFVAVESLNGGPFKRLSNIPVVAGYKIETYISLPKGTTKSPLGLHYYNQNTNIINDLYEQFIEKLINDKVITLNYINDRFDIGKPFPQMCLDISNSYIEWYNSLLINENQGWIIENSATLSILKDLIVKGQLTEKEVRVLTKRDINISEKLESKRAITESPFFKFKGEDIYIEIDETIPTEESLNLINLLDIPYIINILNIILTIMNYEGQNNIPQPNKWRKYI